MEGVAVEGVDGRKMTYGGLFESSRMIVSDLNSLGFSRNDRIAIAFPDGLEMAVAAVAIPSGFTAIPFSPKLKPSELETNLIDVKAKALITGERESPLKDAAKELGIEVFGILQKDRAGPFTIDGIINKVIREPRLAQEEDFAFLMQSSGTTSKPKNILRTNSSICWTVFNMNHYLAPAADDLGLIAAPLFHAQGLFVLYSSLFAGSASICAPFNPLEFYDWLEAFRPTWYIGGPTLHQWVMDTAAGREALSRLNLKVIRTGAGSLQQRTMQELEKIFGAQVKETYAMTESGIIAWNPNPSRDRRFRICYPFGPEIKIIGEDGRSLGSGEAGEIAVRGPEISLRYEDNPEESSLAFVDGWFKTGDRGFIDDANFLHLIGRLKEFINRGGEKVSPQEIEEALLEHPAVADAVSFPIPHQRLGEDVAAAVVLKKGAEASEKDLRIFLFKRLAYFKVPTRIVFIGSIPKGPSGKANRLEMAKTLGIS
jgi:acyl-CoA synthetase (AMP-forming)/AMP-acid ligase II